MSKELARELIGAGVHFGHAASRWNPKMKPYIFGTRGMIHIIDVKETLKGLIIAKKLLADVVSSGKDVVFVGTKRQAQKAVAGAAEKCGMHYVCERWLGGMLTNFRTVRSRLQRLEELENLQASGKMEAESKKQASRLKREMRKILTNLGGVRKMNRLPGVVVVVDVKKEITALREARKLGLMCVGIIDTDSNPDNVDVAIPANDDSIKAIDILLNELVEAVAAGKMMARTAPKPTGAVRGRSKRQALASATEAPKEKAPVQPAETATAEAAATSGVAGASAEVVPVEAEPVAVKSADPANDEGKTSPAENKSE
ncbi:MAG: 30S ribosomal protein S2 [Planctomycetes bacterium]|nr:30S ribosomal protein S2 [Planctomycetota bacterium]